MPSCCQPDMQAAAAAPHLSKVEPEARAVLAQLRLGALLPCHQLHWEHTELILNAGQLRAEAGGEHAPTAVEQRQGIDDGAAGAG